jgi:hypothetical protein
MPGLVKTAIEVALVGAALSTALVKCGWAWRVWRFSGDDDHLDV